jgi:hypothetical protein
MVIKVITRHYPINYGSLLQAFATIKVLEKLGHHAYIIDYRRKSVYSLKYLLSKVDFNSGLKKTIFDVFRAFFVSFEHHSVERKFVKMRKRYLKMTETYYSCDGMAGLKADCFVTGSDQVWGIDRYDETYFLPFVNDGKKIAYSASFGKTDIDENYFDKYTKWLKLYSHITVRENSAVDLLNKMGIDCMGVVLDPVLLLTKDEWNEFIEEETDNTKCDDRLLIYYLHNNPELRKYVRGFSKCWNIKYATLSATWHHLIAGGEKIFAPEIKDYIKAIKHCKYFITDSFHGTVFALLFNKNFSVILPNDGTETRIKSLLEQIRLEDRIITDLNEFSIMERDIDYNHVNEFIAKEREHSINLLDKMIKN